MLVFSIFTTADGNTESSSMYLTIIGSSFCAKRFEENSNKKIVKNNLVIELMERGFPPARE